MGDISEILSFIFTMVNPIMKTDFFLKVRGTFRTWSKTFDEAFNR